MRVNDDEIMVSFEALFPSIPIKHALNSLRNHLEKHAIDPQKITVYLNAAKMCKDMNFFEFRGRFFKKSIHVIIRNKFEKKRLFTTTVVKICRRRVCNHQAQRIGYNVVYAKFPIQ